MRRCPGRISRRSTNCKGRETVFADLMKGIRSLQERNTHVKALCLHVAHTCNLNCSYCFASQGKFHGERALMSAETARAAMDFLVKESGSHYNLDVDFFGGEPLMNWDVVKETVRYGRELEKKYNKNIRFTLTTNGVGIDDEVIEFANREMHNVVLSLDGRKESTTGSAVRSTTKEATT